MNRNKLVGRFNGATSFRTWIDDQKRIWFETYTGLQWSHVLSDVDSVALVPGNRVHPPASMEPRPFGRG